MIKIKTILFLMWFRKPDSHKLEGLKDSVPPANVIEDREHGTPANIELETTRAQNA